MKYKKTTEPKRSKNMDKVQGWQNRLEKRKPTKPRMR